MNPRVSTIPLNHALLSQVVRVMRRNSGSRPCLLAMTGFQGSQMNPRVLTIPLHHYTVKSVTGHQGSGVNPRVSTIALSHTLMSHVVQGSKMNPAVLTISLYYCYGSSG